MGGDRQQRLGTVCRLKPAFILQPLFDLVLSVVASTNAGILLMKGSDRWSTDRWSSDRWRPVATLPLISDCHPFIKARNGSSQSVSSVCRVW